LVADDSGTIIASEVMMTAKSAAWFGTFLCLLALAMSLIPEVRQSGVAYAVFFSCLPVVFFSFARQQQLFETTIAEMKNRIEKLEAHARPSR
jgi:hypothetical protein